MNDGLSTAILVFVVAGLMGFANANVAHAYDCQSVMNALVNAQPGSAIVGNAQATG